MRRLVWLLVAWLLPLGVVRAEEVPYRADVVGVEGDLRRRVEEASRLVSLTDEPPSSLVALRRRADDDAERIRTVLRSEGYYDGDVATAVDETKRPVAVTVTVTPGPAYAIASFDIRFRAPPGDPGPGPVALDRLGVELGERGRADLVIEAERRLLLALAEQGYPLAKVAERRVVVDHAVHSMQVALDVDTNGLAHFGEVTVTGLDEVRESYVRNRIPWQRGDVFSVEQVEVLRKALVDSRLFVAVKVATAQELEPGGLLPITIDVSEAKHRSFGLGASWASSEGFAGRAYWEHRNLFASGEQFRASAVGGQTRNALDFEYRGPDFLAVDQSLIGSATAEERRTDAFVTRTAGVSAGLEWLLSPAWRLSASTALERTFEEE
ncbi:MAG: autotransporter assembly complex protein TamA, partial [Solirubrobacterales bacterium]